MNIQYPIMDPKPHALTKRWHVMAGVCLINGFRKGAELGVSRGRFTSYLCSVMPEMKMIAVDLWASQPDLTAEGTETYEGWNHDESYQNFKDGTEHYFPGRVEIHRMKTTEAAPLIADGSLDFIFIDADHSYEGCSADIEAWRGKVRRGGIIAGHDFNWPTVAKSVADWLGDVQVLKDNVWIYIQK